MMTKYTTKWCHIKPYTNIWGSAAVKNENEDPLDQSMFSHKARRIQYVVDMVKMKPDGSILEKSVAEMCQEYHIEPLEASRMLQIMRLNLDRWNIQIRDLEVQLPIRPAIITLIMMKTKGCKEWTKLLKFKHGIST